VHVMLFSRVICIYFSQLVLETQCFIIIIIIPRCLTWLNLAYANAKTTGLMPAHTQASSPIWPSTLIHQEETGSGGIRLGARYRQRLARDGVEPSLSNDVVSHISD
jgi:hypothetical protein